MKLSTVQSDAIQELGNIGAAHAATTLSQMLGSTVEMSVPAIKAIDIAELGSYMGEESAAMVAFELQGEIPHGGFVIFYISKESAIRLTNTMLGMTDMDRAMNEMDESALIEVGNIMVSAFLDATAELLGFIMLPSPPALSLDMAHAAMASLVAQMGDDVDEVLLFSTELVCEEHKIDSDIIMLPETATLKRIVELMENMMKGI
ncbi:MAG: chemotaxis protein CheC [Methanoregula sp.]|jgi:chemotaxis protein CheC|uniref:chemotaxis protein CheC n=1 Tax=Methanoregula sp. TaxID=2052170 RepID=UPI0025FA6B1B|nr:chemotaxis protein CheC [Methanoregula sp.]MCK9632727.1 chemotaxis protein CheC [Methanoregula sp.]